MRTTNLGYLSTLLMVVFLLGSACNGCGKQPEFCKGLELSASEGQPLDEIEVILDLPEEEEGSNLFGDVLVDSVGDDDDDEPEEEPIVVGDLFAEVTAKGLDDPYYTIIKRDEESGTYALVVPPHPDGIEGGKVKLRLMNASGECRSKEKFEILPLEKAPGTLESMVEKLRRIAELQADALGYTLEDLETETLDSLPTPLWGPMQGVFGADSEENSNSLQKLADGDAEVDVSEGLEFAEALLAKAGQLEALDEVIEDLEDIGDPPSEIEFEALASSTPNALPARTRQSALSCEDVVLVPIIGRDVNLLSHYMRLADASALELQAGTADQVDLAATIVSTIPHPAAKAAGIIIGAAAFYRKATTEVYANTLPSRLVDPKLEVSKEWFEEDSEESGTWKDEYEVSAASNGINLTGTMFTALVNAIDIFFGGSDLITDKLVVSLESIDVFKDIAQTGATEFIKAHGGDLEGPCVVAPRGWGPFNMSPTIYSEVDYTLAIEAVQGDRWSYKPREIGPGFIEVKVPDGPFPPAVNVAASKVVKQIDVRPITVTIQPGYGRIEPMGELEVRAVVRNAIDTRVEWILVSDSPGASVTEMGADDDGFSTAIVRGADRADDFPVMIKAKALSRSGARRTNYPERGDFGIYNADERIEVFPPFQCVKTGESEEYEARIIGSDDTTIEWTASAGDIDGDDTTATYRATEAGFHTITARHPTLDKSDSVNVVVNECECEYNVLMTGAALAAYGDYTNMSAVLNGRSLTIVMHHPDGYITQIISPAESGLGVTPWGTGTYDAVGDVALPGSIGVVDSYITPVTNDGTGGKVTIEEFDRETHRIAGFFQGRAFYFASIVAMEQLWVDITIRFDMFVNEATDVLGAGEYNCYHEE